MTVLSLNYEAVSKGSTHQSPCRVSDSKVGHDRYTTSNKVGPPACQLIMCACWHECTGGNTFPTRLGSTIPCLTSSRIHLCPHRARSYLCWSVWIRGLPFELVAGYSRVLPRCQGDDHLVDTILSRHHFRVGGHLTH